MRALALIGVALPGLCAAVIALATATASGCSGETSPLALDEPIVVRAASFEPGSLPGVLPVDGTDAGPPPGSRVTVVDSVNNVIHAGQSGKSLSGRSTDDALSIGARFGDLGTGYWIVPTGAPDPTTPGELTWAFNYDVGRDAPPGLHPLLLAAIDANGNAGEETRLDTCITPPIPDNLNACDPTIAPPFAVLSLAWDADVDLDLVVVAPDGRVIDAKHPTTAIGVDGGTPAPNPAKDGVLDRDSNAGCAIDATRRESLVWQARPGDGDYLVYASLFSACGQQAVRFTATLSFAEATGTDTWKVAEKLRANGELLASDASGGATRGLYVTHFSIH
jgi:hypothetical protein